MEIKLETKSEDVKNQKENVIKSYNPATLELIGEVKVVTPDELPNILERSRIAQKKWEKIPIKARIKFLKKIDKYILEHIRDIAGIISEETGKPLFESIVSDIMSGLGSGLFLEKSAVKLLKPKKIKLGTYNLLGHSSYIHYRALGVVGIISPWNFPFGIPFSEVIMALAAGNSVILKPSSETPLTALKIKEILDKVGLPEDLFIVTPGSGGQIGKALAKANVGKIIFTGSTNTGSQIMEYASARKTPITLELGGKDPLIVLEDVDIEQATSGIMWASFVNAGQVCAGAKRVYVQRSIYDKFLEKFKEKVEKLKLGWFKKDSDVTTGPLINEDAVKKMGGFVQRAIDSGAKILTGGKRPENLKGHFFEPTVIYNVDNSFESVREEIFGPIVVIMPFDTIDEAIEKANDSDFALTGSVWTKNLKRGEKIAERMKSGTITINNHALTYAIGATPWGGSGNSGFGRTHGDIGLLDLVEPHHIHMDKRMMWKDPWWHPYNGEQGIQVMETIMDLLFMRKYWKILTDGKKLTSIIKKKY